MYALILSGGRGERLRPLTDTVPKPMVEACGRPILHHQVSWLKAGGVTDVVFLAGYRWEVIRSYFQDGDALGFRAQYSIEDSPLGRGGAIRRGMSLLPPTAGPLVVVNGDVITALPVRELLAKYHQDLQQNPGHMATITVVPFQSPYGIVDLEERAPNRVTGFREKIQLPFWINAGIYILSRHLEEHLPELGDHETETFPGLAASGGLTAYRFEGYWKSVDSFKDLREAEEYLARAAPGP